MMMHNAELQSTFDGKDMIPQQSPSKYEISRQNFASILSAALLTKITVYPQIVNADEPSNLYYKSKACVWQTTGI